MSLITREDIIDIYQKTLQRGLHFIISKLNPNALSRTKSAFNDTAFHSSNWWIIPKVKERWNQKITGDKAVIYEQYIRDKYLKDKSNLTMLSIGSGMCSHEIEFAGYDNFNRVVCLDIADNLLKRAKEKADAIGLSNIEFHTNDIRKANYNKDEFDVILFHSSLHHFSQIENLISQQVSEWLKADGLLIINEYVGNNRLQYHKQQIQYINKGLKLIPNQLRNRYKTNLTKNRYYGSGYLRMVLADPSECVESANIISVLHRYFEVVEEKPYGGNLLMSILKDISHNFVDTNDQESQDVLRLLFDLEDNFLKENTSDFLFGIYKMKA